MFSAVDIKVDADGDIELDEPKDIKLATPQETLSQEILFRIKTDHLDYAPDPYIGANLTQFVEEENTRRKSEQIIEQVSISLSRNPIFPPEQLFVDAVPLSANTMAIFAVFTGAVDGTKDSTIVTHTIDRTIGRVDNESIINTTVL